MLSIAAAQLGYRCHIYAPEEAPPAADGSAAVTQGDYGDGDALRRFAAQVDVVTYEFENIETGPVVELADVVTVRPSIGALQVSQDRLSEKDFVSGRGGRPAPYRAVSTRAEQAEAPGRNGVPPSPQTNGLRHA